MSINNGSSPDRRRDAKVDVEALTAQAKRGRQFIDPALVASVCGHAEYLLAEHDLRVWDDIPDGALVTLRMPSNLAPDAFGSFEDGARRLWHYLNRDGRQVHIVVLDHDTGLDEVDEDVMAQAGWTRIH